MKAGPASNRYSDSKIIHHPGKLESFVSGKITAPVYVRFKPTNRCNHACEWCVYSDGSKRKGDRPEQHIQSHMHTDMVESDVIPLHKALETLDCFQRMGVKAVTYSGGGEPLMYPAIVTLMARTLAHGIDLSIITNGQMLTSARAEVLTEARWVRVSMDYTDARQMADSRNVPEAMFDKVLENLAAFARMKSGCDLGVNFIITRKNAGSPDDLAGGGPLVRFARTLRDLGVKNVRFSPLYCEGFQAYHAPHRDSVGEQLRVAAATLPFTSAGAARPSLPPSSFSVNSTFDLDSSSKKPERAYAKCLYMQTVPVVGADQNVYACHNKAFDKTGLIGSIAHQSFEDLWFSEEARAVFEGLNPQKVCRHECANDSKNLLFHQLAGAHRDNFV